MAVPLPRSLFRPHSRLRRAAALRPGPAPGPTPVPLPVRAPPPLARLRSVPCPRRLRWELPRRRAERGSGEEGRRRRRWRRRAQQTSSRLRGGPSAPSPPLGTPCFAPTGDPRGTPLLLRPGLVAVGGGGTPKDLGRVWETPARTPRPTARNERRRVAATLGAQGWLGHTRVDKRSALQNEIFKMLCQHRRRTVYVLPTGKIPIDSKPLPPPTPSFSSMGISFLFSSFVFIQPQEHDTAAPGTSSHSVQLENGLSGGGDWTPNIP